MHVTVPLTSGGSRERKRNTDFGVEGKIRCEFRVTACVPMILFSVPLIKYDS